MKKRIEHFVKTYFYFNKIERKGVFVLICLICITLLIKWSIPFVYPAEPIKINLIKLSVLDEANTSFDTSETNSIYKNDYLLNNNNQFEKHKVFSSFIKDSFNKVNKVKIKYPVDLNKADSVELVALYRIGPGLATKIIQYRNKLGGFRNLNQLTEIYGFNQDILYDLEGKIMIGTQNLKQFNLNNATFEELKLHPYFKYNLSQAIVNFRKQHGNFNSINDLKSIKIVNDSILNLIKPYIYIE